MVSLLQSSHGDDSDVWAVHILRELFARWTLALSTFLEPSLQLQCPTAAVSEFEYPPPIPSADEEQVHETASFLSGLRSHSELTEEYLHLRHGATLSVSQVAHTVVVQVLSALTAERKLILLCPLLFEVIPFLFQIDTPQM